MVQRVDVLSLISKLNRATGVKVAVGMNAYVEYSDTSSLYAVLIDPSGLTDESASKIEEYAGSLGLSVDEKWNDWGRFIKIVMPRHVSGDAFAP
jgi:hypothetical protein